MNIQTAIHNAQLFLKEKKIKTPDLDSQILMAEATKKEKEFLILNHMNDKQINIIDFDKDNLPIIKFDIVTSLFSLDYHYDFELYSDYLRKVSKKNTKIIFDTIRAEFFKKIFRNVKIIESRSNTVHRSKRIMCNEFIEH